MRSNQDEIRVLVAEVQVDLNRLISSYLNGKDNIRVIDSVNDGKTAYDRILVLRPDVAVIGILMPVLDGLAVMEKSLTDKELHTKFIVISSINDPVIAQESFKIGASYFMLKPLDLEVLSKRIRLVHRCGMSENMSSAPLISDNERFLNNHINIEIMKLLLHVNVPAHLNGYQYLQEAIRMTVHNADYIFRMTKVIYPGLAKKFQSTSDRVERSIRNAIEHAWSSGNIMLKQAFMTRPTNAQFISWMSEKIRIDNGLSISDMII